MKRILSLLFAISLIACGGASKNVDHVVQQVKPAFDARVHMPDNTWGVLRANGKMLSTSPYYAQVLDIVVSAEPMGQGKGREAALTSLLPNTDSMHIAFEVNKTGIGSIILEGDYAPGQVEEVFKKMATAPVPTTIAGKRALSSNNIAIVEIEPGKWLYAPTASAASLLARKAPPALFADARFQNVASAVDFNNGALRFAGIANERIRQMLGNTPVVTPEQANKVEGVGVRFEWNDGVQVAIVLDSVDEAGAQSIASVITQMVDRYKSNLMVKMSGFDSVLAGITSTQEGNRVRTELNLDDPTTKNLLTKGAGLLQLFLESQRR